MKEIFNLAKPYMERFKWKIALLVMLSACSGLLTIAMPYVTGSFVDFLISPMAKAEGLAEYCLIFLCVALLGILLGYGVNMGKIKTVTKMAYGLNRGLIKHVHSLPCRAVDDKNPASLTQRINNDSNQVITYCMNILCNFAINLLTLLAPLFLLMHINAWAALVAVLFGMVYASVYFCMRKRLYQASFGYKEAQAIFFGHLNDQVRFFRFIKDNGIFRQMLDRLDATFSTIFAKTVAFQRLSYAFTSLDGLILTFSHIALFILGGMLVIYGKATVGEFTIMNSYVATIFTSIRFFFGIGRDTQDALVSRNRISEILNQMPEKNGMMPLERPSSIAVRNVSCTVRGQKLINGLYYKFTRGVMYAVVGPNGCGKTTLASLLLGENQEYADGSIFFDDISCECADMALGRLDSIGYCEQEPVLLDDTLHFNLTLGNDVEKSELERIVKTLGLREVISRYPDGLDARMSGPGGLSGGEKQKIALARVLTKNKPIMILDEPTSSMDEASKRRIMRYLNQIKPSKLIIAITHDQDILPHFDKILTMNACGSSCSREQLMN